MLVGDVERGLDLPDFLFCLVHALLDHRLHQRHRRVIVQRVRPDAEQALEQQDVVGAVLRQEVDPPPSPHGVREHAGQRGHRRRLRNPGARRPLRD